MAFERCLVGCVCGSTRRSMARRELLRGAAPTGAEISRRRGARRRDASCCAELLLRELAAALGVEPHNDKKMEVLQQVQG
eukprot:1171275-Prymnesium_polylepis.1